MKTIYGGTMREFDGPLFRLNTYQQENERLACFLKLVNEREQEKVIEKKYYKNIFAVIRISPADGEPCGLVTGLPESDFSSIVANSHNRDWGKQELYHLVSIDEAVVALRHYGYSPMCSIDFYEYTTLEAIKLTEDDGNLRITSLHFPKLKELAIKLKICPNKEGDQ